MALEALSLEDTDFSDIPRSNARYYTSAAPVGDPISYVFETSKGHALITNADRFLCLTGVHLARHGRTIEATRTVSPGFTSLPREILDSFVEFHDKTVKAYRIPGNKTVFDRHADKLLRSGATLPGGVAGRIIDDRV